MTVSLENIDILFIVSNIDILCTNIPWEKTVSLSLPLHFTTNCPHNLQHFQGGGLTLLQICRRCFQMFFLWIKNFVFWLKFHRSMFRRVQLTKSQHWFRYWLGPEQTTSHCLNQCWPRLITHIYAALGRDELTQICSSFSLLRKFLILQNLLLCSVNHSHIWLMSLQLSCGGTCQIWMWYSIGNQYLGHCGKSGTKGKL